MLCKPASCSLVATYGGRGGVGVEVVMKKAAAPNALLMVNLMIERDQLRRLDRLARAERRSRSNLVRLLIDRATGRPAPAVPESAAG